MYNIEDCYDKPGNKFKWPIIIARNSQQKPQFLMLLESEQSKEQGQGAFRKKNFKIIKTHLIKLLKKLENDINMSASINSVNISTARIED